MDDLNGLDWSTGPKEPGKPPPMSSSSLFSAMRASPASGRTTPLSASSIPASNPKPPSKPATPANDSFANLVSFGAPGANNSNLSLLEKQKLLQEQKAKQEAEKRSQFEAQYGGQNAQFWDNLDQAPKQPAARSATSTPAADDDFLAAFNASAPVDASTNFPVPSTKTSTPETSRALNLDDDDDPFGLGQMPSKSTAARPLPAESNDDDDFLGLLGKPVSELPQPQRQVEPQVPTEPPKSDDPRDRAIAELVDMGFPPEKAAQALESTESGVDVQAAVGWLLNQAHSESRQKTRAKSGLPPEDSQPRSKRQNGAPSWMKGDESHRAGSPASRDRDVGEMASNFGNQLFKTANTLWKTGSKKVQQAVHDFNSDADPSRPRWMQEASLANEDNRRVSQAPRANRTQGHEEPQRQGNVTDEALLLESDAGRPAPKASRRPKPAEARTPQYPERFHEIHMEDRESRAPPPLREQREQRPQVQQQRRPQQPNRDVKSQLNRGALEEQSAQAYVSPARRRRTPQPPKEEPAVDLFESPKPVAPAPSSSGPPSRPLSKPKSPAPLPSRPKTVARSVPNVSPSALASFHKERESGNEAYKRGDYAAAHESFTRSLSHLPGNHPVVILALSNRAMTALKIGEPKVAISDTESVLTFIGPSKGEGESVELGNGQPAKPMRDFFGKAIMRKAEALEHLEKWAEAAQVWKQAVESGHGGGASIQGRNRCEKAAGISKPPSAAASRSATPRAQPAAKKATPRAAPSNAAPTTAEAVTRLRAANEAAERADEEKLALTDSVDARLTAWKDGKQDNLRALLGSLDSVLWPEAGWKKVGLAELVLPNKVKIQYMKGIAKVHPDKISTNATTEQRMIAGAVFSTLNEAWDKFRQENNL